MSKLEYIPLNGDMLAYGYTKDHFIMMFSNSGCKYHLPKNWHIEKLTKDKVPYRLYAQKCNGEGITVATSTICNEVNLFSFIKGLVVKYNDPLLKTIKVTRNKETIFIDTDKLDNLNIELRMNIASVTTVEEQSMQLSAVDAIMNYFKLKNEK